MNKEAINTRDIVYGKSDNRGEKMKEIRGVIDWMARNKKMVISEVAEGRDNLDSFEMWGH